MPQLPRSWVELDIDLPQGSDFRYSFTLQDRDGNVLELLGWSARMQGRDSADDSLIFDLTEGDGITIDTSQNKILIVILASETAAFDFEKGRYDLEVFNAATVETRRVLAGRLTLSDEVTV